MTRYHAEEVILPILNQTLKSAKETHLVKNQVGLLGNISTLGSSMAGIELLAQCLDVPNASLKAHVLDVMSYMLNQLNDILLTQEPEESPSDDEEVYSFLGRVEIDRSEASKLRAQMKLEALIPCYPKALDILRTGSEDLQVSAVHLLGYLAPHCADAYREVVTFAKQPTAGPRFVSAVIFSMSARCEFDEALWLDFMTYCISHTQACVRKDALCVLLRTPQLAEKLRAKIDQLSQSDPDQSVQMMAEQLLEAIASVVA